MSIKEPIGNSTIYSRACPGLQQNMSMPWRNHDYRQIPDIIGTSVGNKTLYHSDVVGASPVGSAPTIFVLDLTPGLDRLRKDNKI